MEKNNAAKTMSNEEVYETIAAIWDMLAQKIDIFEGPASREYTQWSIEIGNNKDRIQINLGTPDKLWIYIKSGGDDSPERFQRTKAYSAKIRNSLKHNQKFYTRKGEREGRTIGILREWCRDDKTHWNEIIPWVQDQVDLLKKIINNVDEHTDSAIETITSELKDDESSLPVYQIATYPADYTLEVLHRKWKNNEINVPTFQRNFVWTQNQSSRLIESFLVGLPVPAVFLYTVRDSQDYLVIDGQQRLRTVFDFFEGRFGDELNGFRPRFDLKGLNESSEYVGKTFSTLERSDRKKLRNATLRAFIVMQLEQNDDTSMFHIFERLNTGGTTLANQEIRDCVYHGELSKFLDDLNRIQNWRTIFGKLEPDRRKRDVELILRFFALRSNEGYKKPMKIFLNNFMKKNRNPKPSKLLAYGETFEATCQSVVDCLGARPFHIRSGINVAVFDAVMIAFSHGLSAIPEDIGSRFRRLIYDRTFQENTMSGTTDESVVARRLDAAATHLFGT